jgi:hypothetical protein
VRELGLDGHEQHRARPVVIGSRGVAGGGRGLDLGSDLLESVLGVGEEVQPEHGSAVFAWRQGGVGSQLLGRRPKGATDLSRVSAIDDVQLLRSVLGERPPSGTPIGRNRLRG